MERLVRLFISVYIVADFMTRVLYLCIAVAALLAGCKKEEPATGNPNQITGVYCNDPKAVNYNKGFPGTPDNSICIYPTDVFRGTYVFIDSIFDINFRYDTVYSHIITLEAVDLNKMLLKGLCSDSALPVTADRFYKATIDSSYSDYGLLMPGHWLCSKADTISGFLVRSQTDSTILKINLTVLSDTGLNYHIGSAKKQ